MSTQLNFLVAVQRADELQRIAAEARRARAADQPRPAHGRRLGLRRLTGLAARRRPGVSTARRSA